MSRGLTTGKKLCVPLARRGDKHDRADRVPSQEYEKRTVTVEVSGSSSVDATTYVWIVEGTNELLDQDWSPERFAKDDLPGWLAIAESAGQLGWFGFPEDTRDGSKVG